MKKAVLNVDLGYQLLKAKAEYREYLSKIQNMDYENLISEFHRIHQKIVEDKKDSAEKTPAELSNSFILKALCDRIVANTEFPSAHEMAKNYNKKLDKAIYNFMIKNNYNQFKEE